MNDTHLYEVSVQWDNDRKGTLRSAALTAEVAVATPPEFPKGMEGIWSPEHLFTAAVNSCLMTTFLSIAENSKLAFVAFESKAWGKLEMIEGKYQMSEVKLMPTVTVADAADVEKADRILRKSEANCLISNSVRSKIVFSPTVVIVGSKSDEVAVGE